MRSNALNFSVSLSGSLYLFGARNDKDVYDFLGIKQSSFSNRKTRGSIFYAEIIDKCLAHGISFDAVFRDGPVEPSEIIVSRSTGVSGIDADMALGFMLGHDGTPGARAGIAFHKLVNFFESDGRVVDEAAIKEAVELTNRLL